MPTPEFSDILARLADGGTLSREASRTAMDMIMSGSATPGQIGAFLMALRLRGETAEEIAGAAESMRSHAATITTGRTPLLDTCGTGGDGLGTFNISTAAAFVVAGAGVAVAKHGNRSVSSRCGSADVLEALGARIDLPPEGVKACLERTGVGFLFAPAHHRAMRHAAGVRKDLGVRTLFNLLGPLCNPANATHQLIGVFDARRTEILAKVLWLLGSEGAMVVHGAGGLDEIALHGPTRISEWRRGVLRTGELDPGELGIAPSPPEDLIGGDAVRNAKIIREVLEDRPGPRREVVVLNAGAALYVGEAATDLKEGIALARESLATGNAGRCLDSFLTFTGGWGS